ncbi:MAG: VWA domain-containing protein [SAR324 cluster bacterium]|nr:VWA domain-containing protein [SAR324 cluster bacterium]
MSVSVESVNEQETPEHAKKSQIEARIARYHSVLQTLSHRISDPLRSPHSSLQQISLLASQKMLEVVEQIFKTNAVHSKPYFSKDLSEELNLSLLEQIFHLTSQDRFEEFVLSQMFGLDPKTLLPLPLENRIELAENWEERFLSSEQAIQVEASGKGSLRGLTDSEQQFLFDSLDDGSLQLRAYPDEEKVLLKPEVDKQLKKFGKLLGRYTKLIQTHPPATFYSVTQEQRRYDRLIDVYSSPSFIVYQYFRCMLDYIENQRDTSKINLLEHAQKAKNEKKETQTGDKDLDVLYAQSGENSFIYWPTGEEQIYGQEQYLKHFFTKKALDHIEQVAQISKETTLTVFVFDVSGSMLAHDVPPSRFEYALDLQEGLVRSLDSTAALAQVVFSSMGIVSHIFGQEKSEFLDLLLDSRLWFHRARNALLADMFGFTSLGAGLLSAASLIEQTRNTLDPWGSLQAAQILLFTDGDHNCPPNFYQAAKFCQQRRIDVHTICCAREICVEVDAEEGISVETLQTLVTQEATDRAKKWKSWYADTSFERILKKQHEIVLEHYRHRFQQNLQRSTGADIEALETITELTGGHFFSGAIGDRGPTTADEIMEVLDLRKKVKGQLIALQKKKSQHTRQNKEAK